MPFQDLNEAAIQSALHSFALWTLLLRSFSSHSKKIKLCHLAGLLPQSLSEPPLQNPVSDNIQEFIPRFVTAACFYTEWGISSHGMGWEDLNRNNTSIVLRFSRR
jgi:hypothetical protein